MIRILVISRCAAPPYPAAPDSLHGKACHTILRSLRSLTNRVPLPPLFRGQNKTPRNILFISISTVSTGCCATVHILHRMCKLVKVSPRRTMVSFIGMLTLVHPFATTWHFPSRGNEKFRGAFRLSADRPRMTVRAGLHGPMPDFSHHRAARHWA